MTPLPSKAAPDLLPCPFCGGTPVTIEDDSYGSSAVFCQQCDVYFSADKSEGGLTAALKLWNTREQPHPSADADALGEIVFAAWKLRCGGWNNGPKQGALSVAFRKAGISDMNTLDQFLTALRHTPAATTNKDKE